MKRRILCLHQSAELYGSDRSFLSAIIGLKKENKVDVVLPFEGELSTLIEKEGLDINYYADGILRKQELKKPFSYLIKLAKAVLHNTFKFRRYDAIYINTVVMVSAILAATFFRFSHKKIVCHVREIPSTKQIKFFSLLFRVSGVYLIFNSEATKRAFNLPGEVIYNGVDDFNYALNRLPITEKQDSEDNCSKLLLIGRINTWKGHELLIDSIASNLNKDQYCHLKLKIVGSSFTGYEYLEKELNEKVVKYSLERNIEFIPFVNDPSVYFKWADYIVVPSTKPEPFGRVAAEAFSASKPVIAANHGGLQEIVTHGFDGYLFEPGNEDSLAEILTIIERLSPIDYLTMSRNSRLTYEAKFSVEIYQSKICHFINRI
ncbi:glycosyltransferase family 4 protein [Serratia sp. JSRIV001]|uniref:glycosyltransferase family 4 protein n=1 Tax=Serratia TaxID=613 RepID=UPI0003AEAF05|nr:MULTISPECIES: glycosyltransferase family 4 protein [Serratia]ERK14673.1 Glycosyltransferase [Serratia fonticola AU-AP2C]MBL5902094.1 glycosyltransferase family 4 protein [Serratia fonticola]UAN47637.1 glycosyltransferase family 4 protein [Serratia sp. JSRIV001]CAI1126219.1 Mannosylfructose-phosphate synthase [Serratia fonticola]